ncbi:MAG: DMT family transporter [Flavobacteriales bacterium]
MNKAIFHILVSILCFAIVNVFVKSLINLGIPAHELVLFRSLVSILFCIAVIRKLGIPFFGINKKWLLLRGVFGTIALVMFFLTIKDLPLAVATTIQYFSPIFTIIFAIYLNNQRVKPIQWLFFALAFSGIFIMKSEDFLDPEKIIQWKPILLGLGSATLSGMAYNSIIKCKSTDHPITIVMYFPLVAIPLMTLWCLFDFVMPEGIQWLYILLMGCFTQIAQVYMTRALTSEKASIVTPYKYVGSIFAVSFGMIFFSEYLSYITLLGIIIVISGVLINTLYERKWRKSEQAIS